MTDNPLTLVLSCLPVLGLCSAGFFCSGGADSPTPRASAVSSCLCEILEVYTTTTDAALWIHNLPCFNNSSNSGKKKERCDSSLCKNTIKCFLLKGQYINFSKTIQLGEQCLTRCDKCPIKQHLSAWPSSQVFYNESSPYSVTLQKRCRSPGTRNC